MKRDDFLGSFMGNPARAKLLRVLLFNMNEPMTAFVAAKRAGISPKAALKEMKKLADWGIVKKGRLISITLPRTKRTVTGKIKMDTWAINQNFKHLRGLSLFIHEVAPLRYDTIVGALKR